MKSISVRVGEAAYRVIRDIAEQDRLSIQVSVERAIELYVKQRTKAS